MGVLDVLSGLTTAAGKGFEGLGQDQAIQVKNALDQAKFQQEVQRNNVLNAVSNRDLRRLAPGDAGYGQYLKTDQGPGEAAAAAQTIDATAAPKANADALDISTTAKPKAESAATTARALIQPGVEKIVAEAKPLAAAAGEKAGAEETARLPGEKELAAIHAGNSPLVRMAGVAVPAMLDDHTKLTDLENGPDGTPGAIQAVFKTNLLGNYLAPEKVQQYQSAARDWVTNNLQMTGRPATESAIQSGLKTYTYQPGDTPATSAQKQHERQAANARHQAIAGVPASAPAGASVPDHTTMSDEEFAKQYKAGAFGRPP